MKTEIEHKYAMGQTVWLLLQDRSCNWRVRKKKGFVINYIRFTIPKIGQCEILYTFEGYRSHYMTYEKDVFPTLEAAQEECKRRNEWRK